MREAGSAYAEPIIEIMEPQEPGSGASRTPSASMAALPAGWPPERPPPTYSSTSSRRDEDERMPIVTGSYVSDSSHAASSSSVSDAEPAGAVTKI